MSIADILEARKFMERVNTWFYKTSDCHGIPNISDVVNKINTLSECVQTSSPSDKNLCILFDVASILIQQMNETSRIDTSQISPCNSISQSCNNINQIGKPYIKNESFLLSGSKYKSLDTLAGCFTSVQAAGSLIKSSNNGLCLGNIKALRTSHEDSFHNPLQFVINTTPSIKVNSVSSISQSDNNLHHSLQRESTWEMGLKSLPATSSPVNSITEGLDHVSLDEIEGDVILKLCNDTKINMDRIETLLRKSLNRTHNLSKASIMNVSTNSISSKRKLNTASPHIARGSVGRFSLGAAKLPVPKRNVLITPKTTVSPKKIIRPKSNTSMGASAVLQNASRNITTAKRKISSLTSLKDFTPQNNSKLKTSGKGNSISNIPSLRNGNLNSPRNSAKNDNKFSDKLY